MVKKSLIVLTAVSILASVTPINTYAASTYVQNMENVEEESELLPPGIKQSLAREIASKRGQFFSSADLLIEDKGDGDIRALAVGYTRVPVDEAYITVTLQRWDEEGSRWRNVEVYDAEFYAEDYPEGIKTPTVDITFTNQERGYYYRLKGILSVVKDGEFEGFSPVTAGILVE